MAQAIDVVRPPPPQQALPATATATPSSNAPATVTLAVENMHCGACMRSVEAALTVLPGVSAARANLSQKRVEVTLADEGLGPAALVDALEHNGFNAFPLTAEQTANTTSVTRQYISYLGVAGFAAANIMLLSVSVWAGLVSDMGSAAQSLFHWLSALIALPAVAYAGQPFFRSARQALAARRLNMDVPISLGVILATGMSLVQTIRGSEQVYFDAAVTLLFFLLIGRVMDLSVRARAAGAAANLIGLRSTMAGLVGADGRVQQVAADTLRPGDQIQVAAGERIAADGVIRAGSSEIDDSLITGETRLKHVDVGNEVHAGTLNITQPLRVEAKATAESTLLAEIARLMAAAEQSRGRHVQLADRAARCYAPAVHLLALATLIGWLALGHGWVPSLTAAIAVLIITCPCALALAVPVVQVVASSRLFARGVILKASDGLERLADVDTIVFDKTGTLTLGQPRLRPLSEDAASYLAAAATLAQASRHPYARALVREAVVRGHALANLDGVRETPGAGLVWRGTQGEHRLGSAIWCAVGDDRARPSASLWYRAPGIEPIAFQFEDRLRPDGREVVAQLQDEGYRIELLSGDRRCAVEAAADLTGITCFSGGLRPDEKLHRLEQLKRQGRMAAMIGDGLNDAPALAAAHASMSPATATDITQTTADAVFQGERLEPIVETLRTAKAAKRLALQNFALAIGYNLVFVPLAVIGEVTPLIAAIAMSASSLAVTVNAVRLRTLRFRRW